MADEPPSSKGGPEVIAVVSVMEIVYISLLIAFLNPSPLAQRFPFQAFRTITAMIFLLYAVYAIDEYFFSTHSFFGNKSFPQSRGESSPYNALRGLLEIGIPCLWYTIFGRFGLKRKTPEGNDNKNLDPKALEHLIEVVQLLALEPEEQIESLPSFVHVPDELVSLFFDKYEVVVQSGLLKKCEPTAAKLLDKIDIVIEKMGQKKDIYTTDALSTADEWKSVRLIAQQVLKLLNVPREKPQLDWISYVRG